MQLKFKTPVVDEVRKEQENPTRWETPTDRNDGLLGTAVPIMIGAYGIALAIAKYTFWQSADTLLPIAICAVYMIMFFGVPIAMTRIRNGRDPRWHPVSIDSRSD